MPYRNLSTDTYLNKNVFIYYWIKVFFNDIYLGRYIEKVQPSKKNSSCINSTEEN